MKKKTYLPPWSGQLLVSEVVKNLFGCSVRNDKNEGRYVEDFVYIWSYFSLLKTLIS